MIEEIQIKTAKKLLCLKNKDSVILFASRLDGWIKSQNKISATSILRGVNIILKDLQNKEVKEAQQIKKINLEGTKNPIVIAHSKEILELHSNGLGTRKIEKYIKEKYNKKISHATIYNFIKAQNYTSTNTSKKIEINEEENNG